MSTKGIVTLRANFIPTALDAIKVMLKSKVGSVVIADSNGIPEGIVTERDILRMVARSKKSPAEISVGDIMSSPVITVKTYDSLDSALALMTKHKIKRVVAVESDGSMAGVISVTDIARNLSKIISNDYKRYHLLSSAIGMK